MAIETFPDQIGARSERAYISSSFPLKLYSNRPGQLRTRVQIQPESIPVTKDNMHWPEGEY